MLCDAVRTVHGCGLYVQYLGKLSRVSRVKLQSLRASFTRSGSNRETSSVGCDAMYIGACLESPYLRAYGCGG